MAALSLSIRCRLARQEAWYMRYCPGEQWAGKPSRLSATTFRGCAKTGSSWSAVCTARRELALKWSGVFLGNLSTASPRRFTATLLPVLFPLGFARAEQEARSHGFHPWLNPDSAVGRTTILSGGAERDPNRNFPPAGYCHSASEGRDQFGYPIADENIFLQDLIAELSPVAIVSVHCIRVTGPVTPDMRGQIALPGIFADPPTTLPLHVTRHRPDLMPPESDADRLAITVARFVSSRQEELDTGK